jgi:hypothetical protein
MRYPMCSVSSFLTVSVDYTYGFFFTDSYHSVLLFFFCGIIQPIPSLHLIYRSFLRTVVAVKPDNG